MKRIYVVCERCQVRTGETVVPTPTAEGIVAVFPVFTNKKKARKFATNPENIIEMEELES